MAAKPSPTISIITVSYQAAATIQQTVESVLHQSYPQVEYLIVDGASTDGTLDILNRYKDRIDVLISEPDKGLYDAMNKGLQRARGEYVYFLNADDTLKHPDVLRDIFACCPDADVYYGETQFVSDEPNVAPRLRSEATPHQVPEHLTWKSLKRGMVVSHQAFIIRRSLAVPYDLTYRICSDIDWMIRSLKNCRSTCNTHVIFSTFRMGGTSKQQQKRAWKERYLILAHHYGWVSNMWNHLCIVLRYLVRPKY